MTAAIFFSGDGLVRLCWAGPLLYSRMGVLFVFVCGRAAGAYYYLTGVLLPGAGLLRPRQVVIRGGGKGWR